MFRRNELFDEMFDMLSDFATERPGRRLLPAGSRALAASPSTGVSLWPAWPRAFSPAVECFTRDNHLVVRAELPGVNPADVEVSLTGGLLVIRGEKREQSQSEEGQLYFREVTHGQFERSFQLPEGVKADEVKAAYTNGVLEITVPVEGIKVARKVPIDVGDGTTKKAIKAA